MKEEYNETKTAPGAVFVDMKDIAAVIGEAIDRGQSVELSPRGKSMLPLLREGRDSVTLSPKGDMLRKYDLPLYRRADGSYVLHRVVRVRENDYVMCGDNQYINECGITHSQIIAVVTKIRRGKRSFGVDDFGYRLYSALWCISRPVRHFVYRVIRKLKKVFKA